jgi:hypothetical protein
MGEHRGEIVIDDDEDDEPTLPDRWCRPFAGRPR